MLLFSLPRELNLSLYAQSLSANFRSGMFMRIHEPRRPAPTGRDMGRRFVEGDPGLTSKRFVRPTGRLAWRRVARWGVVATARFAFRAVNVTVRWGGR